MALDASDYFEHAQTTPPEQDLRDVVALVTEQANLESTVEQLEADLKETKKNLRRISENLLPAKMTEVGLSELKMADASVVEVKDIVRASITKENKLKRRPLKKPKHLLEEEDKTRKNHLRRLEIAWLEQRTHWLLSPKKRSRRNPSFPLQQRPIDQKTETNSGEN